MPNSLDRTESELLEVVDVVVVLISMLEVISIVLDSEKSYVEDETVDCTLLVLGSREVSGVLEDAKLVASIEELSGVVSVAKVLWNWDVVA